MVSVDWPVPGKGPGRWMIFWTELWNGLDSGVFSAGDEQPAVHPGERGYTRAAVSKCEVYPSGSSLLPARLQHQLQGECFSRDYCLMSVVAYVC